MEQDVIVGPGALICQARSLRGLSIDDVARATRLRPGLLLQFEDEDFTDAGGSAYARGHLRTIGAFLQMDPEDLVGRYESCSSVRRPPGA